MVVAVGDVCFLKKSTESSLKENKRKMLAAAGKHSALPDSYIHQRGFAWPWWGQQPASSPLPAAEGVRVVPEPHCPAPCIRYPFWPPPGRAGTTSRTGPEGLGWARTEPAAAEVGEAATSGADPSRGFTTQRCSTTATGRGRREPEPKPSRGSGVAAGKTRALNGTGPQAQSCRGQ